MEAFDAVSLIHESADKLHVTFINFTTAKDHKSIDANLFTKGVEKICKENQSLADQLGLTRDQKERTKTFMYNFCFAIPNILSSRGEKLSKSSTVLVTRIISRYCDLCGQSQEQLYF